MACLNEGLLSVSLCSHRVLCVSVVNASENFVHHRVTEREHGGCTARLSRNQSWLQRSQMFIEPLLTTIRAPAERNVSGDEWEIEHVSLLWSDEESHGGRAFYKHFVPTGRGSCARKTLSEKQEVTNLLHRENKSRHYLRMRLTCRPFRHRNTLFQLPLQSKNEAS
jgi:hypothetical protein